MKGYLFPGQASQFAGMGKSDYEAFTSIESLYETANDILGFRITDIMFEGTEEELKQTAITQPAVFLYSFGRCQLLDETFQPDAVAGHSLGEFTALTAAGCLSFEDGLKLVNARAIAMQKACEEHPSTMAAIVGLDEDKIESICANINEVVIPANYNCPGQLVISGSNAGIDKAIEELTAAGAKRAIKLAVGGAFHSPLMNTAKQSLKEMIDTLSFNAPICPIYQNVDGLPSTDPEVIRQKLIDQVCAPVYWTKTMNNMLADGIEEFTECGGKVLSGFMRRINRKIPVESV